MNKRAIAEGIDWVIAFGLFITYITLVFVFFKPGITDFYNQETLVTLVQDNFIEDTTWEISKTPIFIAPIEQGLQGNQLIELAGKYSQDGSGQGKVTKEILQTQGNAPLTQRLELFYIEREENDKKPSESNLVTGDEAEGNLGSTRDQARSHRRKDKEESDDEARERGIANARDALTGLGNRAGRIGSSNNNQNNADETQERANSLKFTLSNDHLIIPSYLDWEGNTPKRTKYLLIHSSEILNFQGSTSPGTNNLKTACEWDQEEIPDNELPTHQADPEKNCQAIYLLGVEDKLQGLSFYKFDTLGTTDEQNNPTENSYQEIKKQWGFPETKDFRIDIISPDGKVQDFFPKEVIIPENIDVYARLINTFSLNDEGKREPIMISVKVW